MKFNPLSEEVRNGISDLRQSVHASTVLETGSKIEALQAKGVQIKGPLSRAQIESLAKRHGVTQKASESAPHNRSQVAMMSRLEAIMRGAA